MKPLLWSFKGIWGVLARAAESRLTLGVERVEGGDPSPGGGELFHSCPLHSNINVLQKYNLE